MDKLERNKFITNVLSLLVVQGSNYIVPLIALPFLANVLGLESFSSLVLMQAIALFLCVITDFGFNLYLTQKVSRIKGEFQVLNKLVVNAYYAKVIIFIVVTVLMLLFICLFEYTDEIYLVIVCYLAVLGQTFFPLWFFQGMEEMKTITYLISGSKVLFLILLFIFVVDENDLILAACLQSMPFVLAAISSLYLIFYRKGFHLLAVDFLDVFNLIRGAFSFFASRFSVVIYTTVNIIVLSFFASSEVIAGYSIAEKIVGAVKGCFQPLTDVLYPYMSRTRDVKIFKVVLISGLIIGYIIISLIGLHAAELIGVLFDATYSQSIEYIQYMICILFVSLPSMFIAYPLIAAFGRGRLVNLSTVYGSILHLLNLVVIYVICGEITAKLIIISIFLVETLVFLYRINIVRKYRLLGGGGGGGVI